MGNAHIRIFSRKNNALFHCFTALGKNSETNFLSLRKNHRVEDDLPKKSKRPDIFDLRACPFGP